MNPVGQEHVVWSVDNENVGLHAVQVLNVGQVTQFWILQAMHVLPSRTVPTGHAQVFWEFMTKVLSAHWQTETPFEVAGCKLFWQVAQTLAWLHKVQYWTLQAIQVFCESVEPVGQIHWLPD